MSKNTKKTSRKNKQRSYKQNEIIKDIFILASSKADFYNVHLQMERKEKEDRFLYQKERLQLLSEIYDKSLGLPQKQFRIYRSKIQQLNQLFVEPPYAETNCEDGLSTSSAFVEKEIGKYIAECLQGSDEQKGDIENILSLIQDYKVVQSPLEKSHRVSLERVHSILQDNFPNSSLYKLLEVLINGSQNIKPKVITFF